MAHYITTARGYKFPAIGLGTYRVHDEKELETAIDTAIEAGYRHIDTAHMYNNEHIIGNALKKWFSSGKLKREDLFITTKLPRPGIHPDRVERYLRTSLEKLQLDWVDLYLIHSPICVNEETKEPEPTDHLAVWRKLEELVDAGLTKAIGVSNFNKRQIERIVKNCRIKPITDQVELHIYLQQPELVNFCKNNDIIITSYFSLGNPGFTAQIRQSGQELLPDLMEDPLVKKLAERYQKASSQILLKFLLQKNIAIIPKSVTPSRIKENINLFDFTLSLEDLKALEALDKGEKGRRMRGIPDKKFTQHPEYPFERLE